MQLHSLLSFSFKILECENQKKKKKKEKKKERRVLHLLCIFSRTFAHRALVYLLERVWVHAPARACVLVRVCVYS